MPSQAPDRSNILSEMRALVFAEDTDNSNFVKGLKEYQRYLEQHNRATVSRTAISNWFKEKSRGPSRPEARQFIHGYLLWLLSDGGELVNRAQIQALADRFARELHTSSAVETDQDATAVRRHEKEFRRWKGNQDTLARLTALQGTYQVIRPYVSKQSTRYVLEAMAIEVHPERRQADLLMYSHNQPIEGFMYGGEILPSSRHCFGFVARPDEIDQGRYTFRALTLNVSHRMIASGYEPKYCMSGLLLRGVKGGADVTGNPSVCIPFIVLRAAENPGGFHQPKFVEVRDKLFRLSAESHVLLGEIDERHGELFLFCDRVFSKLGPLFSMGMALRTVLPDDVENAVSPDAKTKQAHYETWVELVRKTFEPKPGARDKAEK